MVERDGAMTTDEAKTRRVGHVLVVNGGGKHAFAEGNLNAMLADVACTEARTAGATYDLTEAFEPFDAAAEVERYLRADLIIYQMPAWWMGTPWPMKRYIDEVFTAGYGSLYAHDGRTPEDPSGTYGSGGLLGGRHYLISATWNAPESAFSAPGGMFEQRGAEALYFPFHKANQMLGLSPLPTVIFADVIKAPRIERDVARYRLYLRSILEGSFDAAVGSAL
jgi:modulator of drug activity B